MKWGGYGPRATVSNVVVHVGTIRVYASHHRDVSILR